MNQINRIGLGLMLMAILTILSGIYFSPPGQSKESCAPVVALMGLVGWGMLAYD